MYGWNRHNNTVDTSANHQESTFMYNSNGT